jgi:hypothetical protein
MKIKRFFFKVFLTIDNVNMKIWFFLFKKNVLYLIWTSLAKVKIDVNKKKIKKSGKKKNKKINLYR